MFEHVEHSRGCDGRWRQIQLLKPRADHWVDATGSGGQGAVNPRLDQRAGNPGLCQTLGHVTVATADIQKRAIRWKAIDQANDTSISVPEPERCVLDCQAGDVA